MRLLVTGGSGFLGGYVLREAAARGHNCLALARSPAAAARVLECGAEPVPGNLDDPDGLAREFASTRCDQLINLASLGFGHAGGIIGAARAAGLDRAVFVSTTAVVTSLPAATKQVRLDAEWRIRESGLDWTIVRPTMIYGAPGDRNLSRLLRALRRTPVFPVPGGRHLQQPVHVEDLAAALVTAAERPKTAGTCYDVAGPEPLAFLELLRTCATAVSSRARFVPVPVRPAIAAVQGYERVSRRPRIRAEQISRLAEDKAFDIGPAVRDLNYGPRSFGAGILAEAAAMGLA